MKRIFFLFSLILTLVLFTSCQDEYKSAFESVCKNVVIGTQDGGTSYTASIEDTYNQQQYVNKIKDKFDKISNVVGENEGELPTSDGKGLGEFYSWESPTVRIILVSEKRLGEDGEIKAVVVKK